MVPKTKQFLKSRSSQLESWNFWREPKKKKGAHISTKFSLLHGTTEEIWKQTWKCNETTLKRFERNTNESIRKH